MDISDKIALFACGVTSSLTWLFYSLYRSRNKTAELIQGATTISHVSELGKLLKEHSNNISYATVEGIVTPVHQKLFSKHGGMEGVIQHSQMIEHRSKRVQGYWSDIKRIIRDHFDSVPFSLTDQDSPGYAVYVTEVENADFLMDDLTVTFDHFEPDKANVLQTGLDRIFGEVTKGYQESEKMLLVSTSLLGIGSVYLENNQIKLGPPSNGAPYILTKLGKNAIIRKFESQSFVFKVMFLIFGTASSGLLLYLVWKLTKRYLENKRNRQVFDEIRALRGTASAEGENSVDQCVICLSNPRDVVVMNCGHVCLCSECAEVLPPPKRCPMCRALVEQFLPLYRV